MSGKIEKIKTLLDNRSKLKSAAGQILYNEKASGILNKHKIDSLPVIKLTELFSLYPDYDLGRKVNIFSDFAGGSSPLNDYYLLCQLLNAMDAKNYFEIGTWVGLSAKNIAMNSSADVNIFTLDIPHNHPDLKIFNIPEHIFGYHSRNIENVYHLTGDSMEFDFTPYRGKMDMVFVDGNHSLEYVQNDSAKALELLKDDTSIIVWHDYLIGFEVNLNVICGILEGIPSELHKHLYHVHQSNTAVFSRSFNFEPVPIGKWDIAELSFDIEIKTNTGKAG